MRKIRRTLIAAAAFAAFAALPAAAQAGQIVDIAVTQVTGTAPFETAAGLGNDTSPTDAIVRSNDAITFLVQINVNDSAAGETTGKNTTITQTLPDGMKWTRLPALCRTTGVVPVSSISVDKKTIICNIGDVETGKALTVPLPANVTEMTEGTVLTPEVDSLAVATDDATPSSTTPDPVTVTSVARVDMVKQAPTVTPTTHNGIDGYYLDYPVKLTIPSFGSRGLIGYSPPAASMSLADDFSGVSPNAEFVSCGPDSGGTWTCPAAGSTSPLAIDVSITNPTVISAATLSSTVVRIFVPKSDVSSAAGQQLTTHNQIEGLDATDPVGNPAVGENLTNNHADLSLSLSPSGLFGVFKHYVDVTNTGRFIPGGSNVDRNGFSTVGADQIFQGEVKISAGNPAAGYSSVAACDVFDSTTQKMTLKGPASDPAHGNGKPAWVTANAVSGGGSFVQDTDFVIEYSSDATSTNPDTADRWTALKKGDCGSGTWTATPPATEAAANAVKRVRLRFIVPPPYRYSIAFAVNLAAKHGAEHTKLANFASSNVTSDITSGWIGSNYDPATHKGNRGDRLILTAAQVRLSKDILDPAVGPTAAPAVRGGEEVQFGLRPQVYAPTQSVNPGSVSASDVTVTDVLPAGTKLSTEPGHLPSPRPSSVTVNANGTTTLVWHLGTKTSSDTPLITYWATVSNTASGTKVNRAMVTSPDDVGSPAAVPSSGSDPHYAARTITVDSLGGIQVDKVAHERFVEPRDEISFSVTYANLDPVARNDMDVIDVLPFNGDGTAVGDVPGRNPASAFHGKVQLKDVDVNDGEIVRFTDAAATSVYGLYDPSASGTGFGSLPAGKSWCTAAQINAGAAGCPASIGAVTAIRVTRTGALAAHQERRFTLTLTTVGNRTGDRYSNTAALRSSSLKVGTVSATRTTRVVASTIGDLVWFDLNRNGKQDRGTEKGVPGVRVILTGSDKHGRAIRVQTVTDANGRWKIMSSSQAGQNAGVKDLVSGRYRAEFVKRTLPAGYGFTQRHAVKIAATENSEPYRSTGITGWFDLDDPTPGEADRKLVIVDAGIVNPPFRDPPRRHRSTSFTG